MVFWPSPATNNHDALAGRRFPLPQFFMKVSRRSYPLDMLAAEDKNTKLVIHTHHHKIVIHIDVNDKHFSYEYTLPELCNILTGQEQ